MNENTDEIIISNKNTLPIATLIIMQPNTIIPMRIIEAEVINEVINEVNLDCNKICLIS
jgi:hypothetical protein